MGRGGGRGSGHPESEIRGGGGGDDLKKITLAGDKHTNQWQIKGRGRGSRLPSSLSAEKLCIYTNNAFTRQDLLDWEILDLKNLEWNLSEIPKDPKACCNFHQFVLYR